MQTDALSRPVARAAHISLSTDGIEHEGLKEEREGTENNELL